MTQELKLMTPLQVHKYKQKNRFISDFKAMKRTLEAKGEKPTTQALCRMLQGKYQKSINTLKGYLRAEGEI